MRQLKKTLKRTAVLGVLVFAAAAALSQMGGLPALAGQIAGSSHTSAKHVASCPDGTRSITTRNRQTGESIRITTCAHMSPANLNTLATKASRMAGRNQLCKNGRDPWWRLLKFARNVRYAIQCGGHAHRRGSRQ